MLDESKGIGIVLLLLGLVTGSIGVFLFFDKFFLSLCNLFYLLGLYYVVGTNKILKFLMDKEKIVGSISFFVGFLLILINRTFIGFLFQSFGVYKLLFTFLPNFISVIKYSPLGFILKIPGIKQATEYFLYNKRLPI
ncbi:protein transport protein GOT1, putative [Hepatocystis sp. ex Piliocolobus tephrosceles]|nr:protein transport protein GOT1, putative [Hepatocystis sp. ex Piliocolobus tephrosceles]